MVNETNILNLIMKNPAPPEPAFQVSRLEQSDRERFDHVLQARVDSPQDEPRFASLKPEEPKNNTDREISRNNETVPVRPDKGHSETSHPAPVHQSGRTVPLSDEPPSSPSRSEQARSNPFALPLTLLADELVPAENNPLQNLRPTHVSDALAGLIETLGVNEQGAAAIDAFREQLAALNIDAETIDRLVDALQNHDAAGLQGILNALRGLLQAAGQGAQAPVPENVPGIAANRLNPPEQRAIDLLIRAGLTRDEAQQVIQQVRAGNAASSVTENAAQLSKTAAESISNPAKPNSDPPAGSGNLLNSSGDNKGSAGNSSEALRNFTGLAGERLETLASLVSPGKSSNPGNAQTNPLLTNTSMSPLLNLNSTGAQPAQGILAEGAPGQAPAALADAASRAVDFVKPAITETYNGRASMDKPITAQIIEKFTMRGFGNQREIHIKLDPPSLGTVRMSVSTNGETVRATIVTENNIVKSLIESNLSQLKDALTNQGVKIDSFNVLVGGNASHSAHAHKEVLEYLGQLGQAGSSAHEPEETSVNFHRPVFLNENQSISVFA